MSSRYDVIIIGAGAMGVAASYHLARRNVSVLCLEQFAVPHAKGSSHGESRKIRLTFYERPFLYDLARRAYDLWGELEQASGQRLVYRNGGIYFGPPSCPFFSELRNAANQYNLPVHELDRNEYPQFTLPDHYLSMFDGTAGILRAERGVAAHASLAMRQGAVIHAHEPVTNWSANASTVNVTTTRETYSADRLLICGGAWSGRLAHDLGVKLTVTRQVLGWVWPKKPERFDLDALPGWGLDDGEGRWYYGFPILDGEVGMKIAHDWHAAAVDPDSINREPTDADEQDFRPCLTRFIPDADGSLLAMRICMYTNSPDGKFIIDRHPHHENVFVACGFSGSGFKYSPVIGQMLTELALDGHTDLPVENFRLKRFE